MTAASLDRLLAILVFAMAATGLLTLRAGSPEPDWVFTLQKLEPMPPASYADDNEPDSPPRASRRHPMADRPVEVVYFYRTKWGHHDEFLELFARNHLPVLQEQVKSGRMLHVRVQVPRFHGDGRADWDVMVTIVYRNWGVIEKHSETEIIERLFPDKARYSEEERRRFTILDAHWDVPLESLPG